MAAKLAFLLAALIAVFALSACGGGDDETAPETTAATQPDTTPAPSLTEEEIIAEGDAICAEVNAAVAGLEATGATPATQLSQRTDLYTGMIERLRGLDSEDPGLTDVFSAGRDLVQAAAAAEEAAAAGDTEATVAAETTVAAARAAFQRAADAYGFTECGGEASAPATTGPASGGADETDGTGEAPVEPAPTPEPAEPTTPSGGADAGSAPPATDGGGAGGGADGGTGAGNGGGAGGGGAGGGNDSSTGGISPTG